MLKRVRASGEERRRALELLTPRREPEFGRALVPFLRDEELRSGVIRALAAFDLPEVPGRLVALYPSLPGTELQDVLQTLSARPASALELIAAVEHEVIPRQDVSALVIPVGGERLIVAITRRVTPPHGAPPVSDGWVTAVSLPEPTDVPSFEIPAPASPPGSGLPRQGYSLRLRIGRRGT